MPFVDVRQSIRLPKGAGSLSFICTKTYCDTRTSHAKLPRNMERVRCDSEKTRKRKAVGTLQAMRLSDQSLNSANQLRKWHCPCTGPLAFSFQPDLLKRNKHNKQDRGGALFAVARLFCSIKANQNRCWGQKQRFRGFKSEKKQYDKFEVLFKTKTVCHKFRGPFPLKTKTSVPLPGHSLEGGDRRADEVAEPCTL